MINIHDMNNRYIGSDGIKVDTVEILRLSFEFCLTVMVHLPFR